jgi:hypothetical protein
MATLATPAVPVGYLRLNRLAGCVEYLSTIRDMSSHRHPTGRPAALLPTAAGSGRGRMDRIGSADRHTPRTSRADRVHMNTDRVMSAIIL